jgi:signal peptidase I
MSDATRKRPHSWRLVLREVVVIVLVALLISFLIKTFLIRPFYIPSASMSQTLLLDDRVIVNELVPDVIPIERGDVIVFEDPGGWLPTAEEQSTNWLVNAVNAALEFVGLRAAEGSDHLIKRVIGLPGDTVVCCDDFGHIAVNGTPIEEPYLQLPPGVAKATPESFEVTVPDGGLWVMGDNRYNSADSAYQLTRRPDVAFVPVENVVGRAVLINWPVNRWTLLDNFPTTFSGVEPP